MGPKSGFAKLGKEVLKSLGRHILSHRLYSPDLPPTDYHLFASAARAFTGRTSAILRS